MINWEIENPTDRSDSMTLYNDNSEEEMFDCTKPLLIKHPDDYLPITTFSKAYYVHDKDEWYDIEGGQIFQVSGWYDLEAEINIES